MVVNAIEGYLKTPVQDRLWQLDLARGLAISAMVVYHVLFDLAYSDILSFGMDIIMRYSAILIGSSFLFIAGISLVLEHERCIRNGDKVKALRKHLSRGIIIFTWGMMITAVTLIAVPDLFVIFGILHCIGASIMLAAPLAGRGRISLVLGITVIVAGYLISGVVINGWSLVWIGIRPDGFTTLDYYPLLPWSGILFIGVWAGNRIIPCVESPVRNNGRGHIKWLLWIGQHSLLIYLIHQPIILIFLFLLGIRIL